MRASLKQLVVAISSGILGASTFPLVSAEAKAVKPCQIANPLPVQDPKLTYQRRGDRCEGFFAVPVASPMNLKVLGFHRGRFSNQKLAEVSNRKIGVEVLGVRDQKRSDVVLLAKGLSTHLHYAMDTDPINSDGSYTWDTTVLSEPTMAIHANELGMIGCTNRCRPGKALTYMPVIMASPPPAQANTQATQNSYFLIVQSGRRVKSVRYTIAGNKADKLQNLTGDFPPGGPISLNLGELLSGRYEVSIVALAGDGVRASFVVPIQVP